MAKGKKKKSVKYYRESDTDLLERYRASINQKLADPCVTDKASLIQIQNTIHMYEFLGRPASEVLRLFDETSDISFSYCRPAVFLYEKQVEDYGKFRACLNEKEALWFSAKDKAIRGRIAAYFFDVVQYNSRQKDNAANSIMARLGEFNYEDEIASDPKWYVPITGRLLEDIKDNWVARKIIELPKTQLDFTIDFICDCYDLAIKQVLNMILDGYRDGWKILPMAICDGFDAYVRCFSSNISDQGSFYEKTTKRDAIREDALQYYIDALTQIFIEKPSAISDDSQCAFTDTRFKAPKEEALPGAYSFGKCSDNPNQEKWWLNFCYTPYRSFGCDRFMSRPNNSNNAVDFSVFTSSSDAAGSFNDFILNLLVNQPKNIDPCEKTLQLHSDLRDALDDREFCIRNRVFDRNEAIDKERLLYDLERRRFSAQKKDRKSDEKEKGARLAELEKRNSDLSAKVKDYSRIADKLSSLSERNKNLEMRVKAAEGAKDSLQKQLQSTKKREADLIHELEMLRAKDEANAIAMDRKRKSRGEKIDLSALDGYKIVVVGGHQNWANNFDPHLKNVRMFPSASPTPGLEDAIRQCDMVWLQTAHMSHSLYSAAISASRKPLRGQKIEVFYFETNADQASLVELVERVADFARQEAAESQTAG